jgi:cytochrome P450
MDQSAVRNRLIQTAMAAAGAAAIAATLLSVFQEQPGGNTNNNSRQQQQQQQSQKKNPVLATTNNNDNDTIITTNKNLIPGGTLPILGDGMMIVKDFIGALKELYVKAKTQPSKMGYLDNFGNKTLILSEPEHIKRLLDKVTAHALWGGIKPASEAFFGKSVLFVLEGEEWKKLRSLMRAAFLNQKLELMKSDITACALDLCNRLEDAAAEGKVVDMNAALSMYHLSAVGKTTFNYNLDVFHNFPASNEISDSFEYLLGELPRRSFSPDQSIREDYTSANPDNLKWQSASNTVRQVVLKAIKNRLDDQHNGAPPRGDLLDAMINAYRESAGPALSSISKEAEAHILLASLGDNLVEMFFAGYNTSAVAMGVALYMLSKPENRKYLEQVQEEIDSLLIDEIPAGKGLNSKDFPTLVRVFQECLRVVPPAPLVARFVPEDLEVGNVLIPAGTGVWIPAVAAQVDVDHWGKDAEEFNPDRWLKPCKPGSYTPFSGGARDCIGKHFAELESVTALAVLLQTYEFEIDPNFKFTPIFTGFGYRPFDLESKRVCVNLIPKKRLDSSTNMYEWTPKSSKSHHKKVNGSSVSSNSNGVGVKLKFDGDDE